jgi:ArsR family transcriptional regulator
MSIYSYTPLMEKLLRVLGDANRLRIVSLLARGPLNVSEIAGALDLGQSNVSHHLRRLLDRGVVRRESRAGWAFYRLATESDTVSSLVEVAVSGLAGTDRYRRDMRQLARVYRARKESSREFFDSRADCWPDLEGMLPEPGRYLQLIADCLQGAETLVEIGCGSGRLLGDLSGMAHRLIGVDHSEEMLRAARRRLGEQSIPGSVELRLGDAEHLPVADGWADGLVAHMVLHHVADPAQVLREAARVLSARGRVALVELREHDNTEFREKQGDLWPGFPPEKLQQWIEDSGLEVGRRCELEGGTAFLVCAARRGVPGDE